MPDTAPTTALRALLCEFENRSPTDIAKIDDELVHTLCGEVLCDVEHGDTLTTLIDTALNHTCPNPPQETAPTMSVTHDEALEFMSDLDKGSNLFGSLSPQVRARLFAVVDKPSQDTWNDAHGIILTSARMTTLWQALLAHTDYDVAAGPPHTPGQEPGPWPTLPTSEQLLIAIRTELTST